MAVDVAPPFCAGGGPTSPSFPQAARPSGGQLPEGWEEHHDHAGTVYYYHPASDTSSWTPPIPPAQMQRHALNALISAGV